MIVITKTQHSQLSSYETVSGMGVLKKYHLEMYRKCRQIQNVAQTSHLALIFEATVCPVS